MKPKVVRNFPRFVTKLNLYVQYLTALANHAERDEYIYKTVFKFDHRCWQFYKFTMKLKNDKLIKQICSDPRCNLQGQQPWLPAFNYFLFPREQYLYECPFEEYLQELDKPWCFPKWSIGGWFGCPSSVGQEMKSAMATFEKDILPRVVSVGRLYCTPFKVKCPQLIITTNQLTKSMASTTLNYQDNIFAFHYNDYLTIIPRLNTFLNEDFFFYEQSFFKAQLNQPTSKDIAGSNIYFLLFELQFKNVHPRQNNEYLSFLFYFTQHSYNATIRGTPYFFESHLLQEIKESDPFQIGNPCLSPHYTLIPQSFHLTLPIQPSSILDRITRVNHSPTLDFSRQYLGVEYNECIEERTPLGESPHFQVRNATLGFIVPIETLTSNSSISIYNPSLHRLLEYDSFPCPTHALLFQHPMMVPVCYILKTSSLNETRTGFLNLTHSLQGSFYASLPNYCHTHLNSQPDYSPDLDMTCFLEKLDDEHLSKSHWMLFDSRTGLLIYSQFAYLLSGQGKGDFFFPLSKSEFSMLLPLFESTQTVQMSDLSLWNKLGKLQSARNQVVWGFSIFSVVLVCLIVVCLVMLVRAERADKLYTRLRALKLD